MVFDCIQLTSSNHNAFYKFQVPVVLSSFSRFLSVLSVGVSFTRLLIKDIIFQDCWMSHNRTSDGQLQPDPTRFPSGMKALGDYVSTISLPYYFNVCLG